MGGQNLVCGELEALRVKNRELKILFAAGTVERIILIRMDQLVRRDRTAAANHFVLDALPHALDQELVTAAKVINDFGTAPPKQPPSSTIATRKFS